MTEEDNKIINRLLKHLNYGGPKHWITKHLPATKIERPISFEAYRKKVRRLTEDVKHLIPGVERRGFKSDHIDHKRSIWNGFKNGIPAEEIAHIDNLRMLPHRENMRKGTRCV